jgi:hypothetical protein
VAGRRFALGDEVVTLTQAGHNLIAEGAPRDRYIRTGTVGRVSEVHLDAQHLEAQWLRVSFAGRGEVKVGWEYLTHAFDDGRCGGLAHSYAVTADRSQGSTMHAARAVATDSTSRQAFYVMTSRGEREVCAYVIRDRDLEQRGDDEQWLPVLSTPGGPLRAVVENLERSRPERLAADLDPVALAAQQLRQGRNLADLAAIARHAEGDPQGRNGGVALIVARRAEMAEQSAVAAAAIASAPPEVVARLGGRPGGGQHRRSWDAAVRAVGVYRARWEAGPDNPGYGRAAAWAIGGRPDGHGSTWADERVAAETLVRRWAARLDPHRQKRFWEVIEHIPRQRATAGIHALIAAGVDPQVLYAALTEREADTAKAGAAILEYRVNDELRWRRVDPAAYQLGEPLSAGGEWDRVQRLLDTAETHSLSRRNLRDLSTEKAELFGLVDGNLAPDPTIASAELSAAEAGHDRSAARLADIRRALATEVDRRRPDRQRVADLRHQMGGLERRYATESLQLDMLRQRLATDRDGPDQAGLTERHDLISAAIDLIVDDAVAAAAAHPARYLTALLGPRPTGPADADSWDSRVRSVEAWRHHHLGLTYGQAAAGADAPPSEQALGPIPDDPIAALSRRRILARSQSTLDLGVSL